MNDEKQLLKLLEHSVTYRQTLAYSVPVFNNWCVENERGKGVDMCIKTRSNEWPKNNPERLHTYSMFLPGKL